MCGGGGGGGTITMPDFRAYDREFDLQREAIMSQVQGPTLALQSELEGIAEKNTRIREKIRDRKVARADRESAVEEEARRLSVLVGTPPPEPTAEAPLVGAAERGISTRKGKTALRINRRVATSTGQGTGLNIT